jgi:hypothetical protein
VNKNLAGFNRDFRFSERKDVCAAETNGAAQINNVTNQNIE